MSRLQNQLKFSFPKFYSIIVVCISNKITIKDPVAHQSISAKQHEHVMHMIKIMIKHIA